MAMFRIISNAVALAFDDQTCGILHLNFTSCLFNLNKC